MAADIKNNADGVTGNSRIGKAVVATGGRGSLALLAKVYDPGQPRVKNTDIAVVDEKFDARLDDPRYYAGDTAS